MSARNSNKMTIEITDERDQFFLYVCQFDDEAFNRFKQEKCFSVDMAGFASYFVEHIWKCQGDDGHQIEMMEQGWHQAVLFSDES